jgi:hypothetical protein
VGSFGADLLFAPTAVQAIIIGATSGVLAFIVLMIAKVDLKNKLFFPVVAGVMAIGLLIGLAGINAAKPKAVPNMVERALREQRLFQVIEKHHPAVFRDLVSSTSETLTKGGDVDLSQDSVRAAMQKAHAKSVPPIMDEAILVASNAALFKLMGVEQDTLEILKEKDPEGCSDFAVGKTGTWAESLSEVEQKSLMDARADILESAAIAPTEHRKMTPQAIARILAGPGGLSLSQLQTFANANLASPRELCSVTIAVYKTLRNQGPVQGPNIYVAVTKLGNTE